MQFHNEEKDEGVINAVRNTLSEESTMTLPLKQMDEKATYAFECPETNETFTVSGKELAKKAKRIIK